MDQSLMGNLRDLDERHNVSLKYNHNNILLDNLKDQIIDIYIF